VFVGSIILFASCQSVDRDKSVDPESNQNLTIEKGPKYKNQLAIRKRTSVTDVSESKKNIEKGPKYKNKYKIMTENNTLKAPGQPNKKGAAYKNKDWVK